MSHNKATVSPCYKGKPEDQAQLTQFTISEPPVSAWSSASAHTTSRRPSTPPQGHPVLSTKGTQHKGSHAWMWSRRPLVHADPWGRGQATSSHPPGSFCQPTSGAPCFLTVDVYMSSKPFGLWPSSETTISHLFISKNTDAGKHGRRSVLGLINWCYTNKWPNNLPPSFRPTIKAAGGEEQTHKKTPLRYRKSLLPELLFVID